MTVAAPDIETPAYPLSALQRAVLAFGLVAMGASMTVNFVVVTPLAREAGLSEVAVAGILTLSTALYAALTPTWGRLSDRFGRKRVMAFSLFAMAATNTAFLFALDAALAGAVTGVSMFLLLALTRSLFGLLSPGVQPAAMAAMAEATTSADRAVGMGQLGTAMSVGSIVGPAGAAVLATFGALAPLWGSIAIAATAGLVILAALPPTRSMRRVVRPKPLSVRDPRIFPFVALTFAYFVGVGLVQTTLAFLVTDRYALARADAVQAAGFVMAISAIAMVVVQFGHVQRRAPKPDAMLRQGLILVAAGYVMAAAAMSFWAVCAGFVLVGVGAALCAPALNALGTLAVTPAEQGGAAGLMASAPPAAFTVGPLAGAVLYMLSPPAPLLAAAAGMGAVYLVYTRRIAGAGARSHG